MPFYLSHKDITTIKADVIVNAANTSLRMGGGVCGAIFEKAGREKMEEACRKLAPIGTGEAVATPAFALPAKYVIHTAGPVWKGKAGEKELLYHCYSESLILAETLHAKSIVFPLISGGIYGCPRSIAKAVAGKAIFDFLAKKDMKVTLVLFGQKKRTRITEAIRSFLEWNCGAGVQEEASLMLPDLAPEAPCAPPPIRGGVKGFVLQLGDPFQKVLFHYIDAEGKTDTEVYKEANIDRRLFSKIRTHVDYTPKKKTILALAVALHLDVEETEELLESAGYSLSRSRKMDMIVRWYMEHGKYDIYEINETLLEFGQNQLGS